MRRRDALGLTAVAVSTALPPLAPAQARRDFPPDHRDEYHVSHAGQTIGQMSFSFKREPTDYRVERALAWRLSSADGVLRHFTHRAEETWRHARLFAFDSETDDNGTLWRVTGRRETSGFKVNSNRFALDRFISGHFLPGSLWHPDTPSVTGLMGVIDGNIKLIRGRLVAEQTMSVRGRSTRVKHFAIRGGLNSDLWYGTDRTLVRVREAATEQALITFELS